MQDVLLHHCSCVFFNFLQTSQVFFIQAKLLTYPVFESFPKLFTLHKNVCFLCPNCSCLTTSTYSIFSPWLPPLPVFMYSAPAFGEVLITSSLYVLLFFPFASIQHLHPSCFHTLPLTRPWRIPHTVRVSRKSCQNMFHCQWDAEWEHIRYRPRCVPDKKQAN